MGYGTELKRVLKEKGITIKGLSEMTQIPLNTLYSITKRDSERVDIRTLRKITDALNVSELDLLSREELDERRRIVQPIVDMVNETRRAIISDEIDYQDSPMMFDFLGENEEAYIWGLTKTGYLKEARALSEDDRNRLRAMIAAFLEKGENDEGMAFSVDMDEAYPVKKTLMKIYGIPQTCKTGGADDEQEK